LIRARPRGLGGLLYARRYTPARSRDPVRCRPPYSCSRSLDRTAEHCQCIHTNAPKCMRVLYVVDSGKVEAGIHRCQSDAAQQLKAFGRLPRLEGIVREITVSRLFLLWEKYDHDQRFRRMSFRTATITNFHRVPSRGLLSESSLMLGYTSMRYSNGAEFFGIGPLKFSGSVDAPQTPVKASRTGSKIHGGPGHQENLKKT
jgi:hypothetical protein